MSIDADVAHDLTVLRSLVDRRRFGAAASVARGMAGYLTAADVTPARGVRVPVCLHGHPQTQANTYGKDGRRRCLLCNREHQRRFDLKKYGKRRPHRGDEGPA